MEIKKGDGVFKQYLFEDLAKRDEDRVLTILKETEKYYKRALEDLYDKKSSLLITQKEGMDMQADGNVSIINLKNFDGRKFVYSDIEFSVKIANIDFSLEVAHKRFKELFGYEFTKD